jgi:hypothetical protein
MKSGDIKQVTMNVEVAGTPVTELVSTMFKRKSTTGQTAIYKTCT